MKKINCAFIIASLIILLIAIGSVYAVSENAVISDGDDLDNEDGDEIEVDDEGDSEDDGEDDNLDEDDDEDLDDEDDSDDSDDSEDDEEMDEDESYDGEFDGEASPLSAGASLDSAKGMSMNVESGLDNGSQDDVNSNHQAGNPIAILLLSLLSLIVIPLRNR
ncbi:hypothetical protein [Methanobrevibacter sp.]|uniref:hypothetical protein n=1 Tax=Methanobrevibacter sp. TaxID=66852 RepID=UPI0025D3844E|nr:hypothetical protein [Methanobrevibacter sp.]MBQ2962303.1 hypothetical protein [Methanobrevibacter sp.]